MDKKNILYVLLILLGLTLVYRMANVSEEKRAPLKYKTGVKANAEPDNRKQMVKTGDAKVPSIELSKLAAIRVKPQSEGMNLFYPFFIKVEPPKPKSLPQPVPIPTIPLPPPVDPLEEELKLFRFMGFLEKGTVKKIFLAKGPNTYIVRSGDTIEGKFKVTVMEKERYVDISVISSEKKIQIQTGDK